MEYGINYLSGLNEGSTMLRKSKRESRGDPLYTWMENEIASIFDFLTSELSMKLIAVSSDKSGARAQYRRGNIEVLIWAEKGSRPEVDIIRDGKRDVLSYMIRRRWQDDDIPRRPEYRGLDAEKVDFKEVMNVYATALRNHSDEIFGDFQISKRRSGTA